jgi:hypothetical protein
MRHKDSKVQVILESKITKWQLTEMELTMYA